MFPLPDPASARSLLQDYLFQQTDATARTWLEAQIRIAAAASDNRSLYTAFALMGRKLGREALALSEAQQAEAFAALEGWTPALWTRADAGRVLLLAHLPQPGFVARFQALCQTAEVAEAVSLYRGLALYPEREALEPQAGEGLRGNMRSVFEAIAHHNPYPRLVFDEHRWTHMVLKAIFVGSRLAPIQGLDQRANPELARILLDFVHERRAAGREVPFEIWRCVGPFARGSALTDLEQALASTDPRERRAAALGLAASPDPAAAGILASAPELEKAIAVGALHWANLA